MKDLRMSEVKRGCNGKKRCFECDLLENCPLFNGVPSKWDIEPRDMMELPCKEYFTFTNGDGHVIENWRVFYRSEFALIGTAVFPTEPEADRFLMTLKGERNEKIASKI